MSKGILTVFGGMLEEERLWGCGMGGRITFVATQYLSKVTSDLAFLN
jgi:hypothetical protein